MTKHDHRRSCWFFTTPDGSWLSWCWKCGALRYFLPASEKYTKWYKPVGSEGKNPFIIDDE